MHINLGRSRPLHSPVREGSDHAAHGSARHRPSVDAGCDHKVIAAHTQSSYRVRFDWGPTGASAVAAGADLAVVVDVLSFTTTLCIAIEQGMTVLPYRWKDDRAASYANSRDAVLAIGRLEARSLQDNGVNAVSLSPAAMARAHGIDRVVLPSPNGSSIAFGLADGGSTVIGSCLRNRTAVAAFLMPHIAAGATVVLIAAGERWPDNSLRPCAEDVWGAGGVLAALTALGATGLSPEATLAASTYRAAAPDLVASLHGCAGGRELIEAGFGEDVAVAAQADIANVVPVLTDGAFTRSS